MNQILSLKELAGSVATATGLDAATVENIVKGWIEQTSARLSQAGECTTMGLGTFKFEDNDVVFIPHREFAAAVNAPFSIFETLEIDPLVEIPDDPSELPTSLDTSVGEPQADVAHESPQEEVAVEQVPVEEKDSETVSIVEEPAVEEPAVEEPAVEEPIVEEPAVEEPAVEEPVVEDPTAEEPASIEEESNEEVVADCEPAPRRMPGWLIFTLGLVAGLIIACVAVYFLYPPLDWANEDETYEATEVIMEEPTVDSTVDEPDAATTTTAAEPAAVATQAVAPQVTDTVSSTRFLATMAREYYGKMEFWVYIYLENSDKLGHPDRIAPGTTVVIPPASKYHIDASSPASVEEARAMIPRLYEPYK